MPVALVRWAPPGNSKRCADAKNIAEKVAATDLGAAVAVFCDVVAPRQAELVETRPLLASVSSSRERANKRASDGRLRILGRT
jgi:hypothetical protein